AVVASVSGTVARQHIAAGEIITGSDVSASGTAGLIPDGSVAFGAPAAADQFSIGDRVAVFADGQLICAGVVVDTSESGLMVAVPTSSAPTVAAALLANTVVLALAPSPPPP
ncbi:MAG TPA: hypothetical protein VGC84_02645, partial [Ilumatobacteraceae bacterium]